MKAIGAHVASQLKAHRKRFGTTVTLRGVDYRVTTSQAAGNKAGVETLPYASIGPFIASADPRLFVFDPDPFTPYTDVDPPSLGEEITWHNLVYIITAPSPIDLAESTVGIKVFCYRKVI